MHGGRRRSDPQASPSRRQLIPPIPRMRQQGPLCPKIHEAVELPFSEKAKNVIRRSSQEADNLESKTIMTKHILSGLLLEEDTLAQQILTEWGFTADTVRYLPPDSAE